MNKDDYENIVLFGGLLLGSIVSVASLTCGYYAFIIFF
jgi:hypothetical protein